METTGRRTGAAVMAIALMMGVTACAGEETQEAMTPSTAEVTTPEAVQSSSEPADTSEQTEEAATETTDAAAEEAGSSTELTEPGASLAIGDPAVIQLATVADPEDDFYRFLKLRTTVVEITEADPAILDGVELATPVEDEVPYLIWVEHEILETEGDYEKFDLYPQIGAIHSDSSSASTIWADGSDIGECTNEQFDSLEPGGVARTCVIALGDGMEITGASWSGNDNADGDGDWEANPYYDDPVIWTP